MNKYNQLKAGTLLSYVNMVISTVIPLLYTPVMLQMLGQGEYGLYGLSGSVTSYLSLLTLGLGSTIHRFYMRSVVANDKPMIERTTGLFVIIYSIIALITVVAGCALTRFTGTLFAKGLSVEEIDKMNMLVTILSVNAGISLLTVPFSSIIVCYERYIFQKMLAIICTIAAPLINLAVLYAGFASVGMAAAGIVWAIVLLGINCGYCVRQLDIRPAFRKLPWEMLKDIFAFTSIVFIGLIADLLYWSTDKVLIGAMVGSAAVAVYNIGTTFNSVMQQMSSAISGVFGTRVNQIIFSGQPISVVSELVTRIGRIQFLVLSLVLSGFIVFGQSFIFLWVGNDYQEAYLVALLTMLPMVVPLIQNIAFNTIVTMNKHHFRSILYVLLAVANVVSTYLVIPTMGIVGAAVCTFGVFTLGHGFIMNWFYYKKIGLDIPGFWMNILKLTVVPTGMVLGSFVLGIRAETILQFAAGVVTYTVVFCVLSWLISMNRYEKNLVIGLVGRVSLRKNRD